MDLTLLSSRLSKGPGGSSKHRNPLTKSLGKREKKNTYCIYIYLFGKQRNPLKPKDSVLTSKDSPTSNFSLNLQPKHTLHQFYTILTCAADTGDSFQQCYINISLQKRFPHQHLLVFSVLINKNY